MQTENENNGMLHGYKLHVQNLCAICVYSTCTNCPTQSGLTDEKVEDFPQIIEGIKTANGIKVLKCIDFSRRAKPNGKVKRKELVWNPKTRHFE